MQQNQAPKFTEGMRVQRISSHRIKGNVDFVALNGMVMVTWDTCGRFFISPNDLKIIKEF